MQVAEVERIRAQTPSTGSLHFDTLVDVDQYKIGYSPQKSPPN